MLKENTSKLFKSFFLNTQWLVALSFFILLFSPKIDLFFIPYRQQGIRVEDFILLIFTLYFLVTNKIRLNPEMPGFNFVAFFPYFLFSFFIGQAAGLPIKWDMVLRFIEYVIFMLFIIENVKDKKFILTFIRFYIIINFIAAYFQLTGVLGGITSVQYFEAGFLENNRPMGLLGGAWELGAALCIAYFIIYHLDQNNKFNYFIFLPMVLFCLVAAETRGNIIAFLLSIFFLYRKNGLLLIFTLFIIGTALFLAFTFRPALVAKLLAFDFIYMAELFRDFFVNIRAPDENLIKDYHTNLSIARRLGFWLQFYEQFRSSWVHMVFGTGGTGIYMESLIFRVVFNFGIVGTLIVLLLAKRLPLYLFIFFIVGGVTLDFFISFKLFMLSYLLIYVTSEKSLLNKKIIK